jgi:outer membrane lipoprotein-sorting protein
MAALKGRVVRGGAAAAAKVAVANASATAALRAALLAPAFALVSTFATAFAPMSVAHAAAESSSSTQSATLVSQIATQLGHTNGIRAHFTQTQTRAALTQPLVSSGTLLLMRGRGIVWHIDAPYQATYLITDAGVNEIDTSGRRIGGTNSHGATGARGVAEVSKMMSALLGGDLSALYSQFDVQASGTPAQWHLQLTPNQPQLAQAIKGLQMSGGNYLQSLRITLASGDITALDFADTVAVTSLTPAEQQLFGAP